MMTEKLAYDLMLAMDLPAPRTRYVRLSLNGQYQGVYLDIERVDQTFAQALARDLIHRGFTVWMDKRDILPGVHWDDEITVGLEACTHVVLILSPRRRLCAARRGRRAPAWPA